MNVYTRIYNTLFLMAEAAGPNGDRQEALFDILDVFWIATRAVDE